MTPTKKQPYSGIFITDGLSLKDAQKRYQKRRDQLIASIGHLTVIYGIDKSPGYDHVWSHLKTTLYQEPLLLYLTGVNQLHTALLLDPDHPTEKVVLFVKRKNKKHEFWEGLQFGSGNQKSCAEITTVTGIQCSKTIRHLPGEINKRLARKKKPQLGLFWHESETKNKVFQDSNAVFIRRLKRYLHLKGSKPTIVNIASAQWQQRLSLDKVDQDNIRTANHKTSDIFKALCTQLSHFQSETEVSGFIDGQIGHCTAMGPSFPAIVAGGENATILHYKKNNDPLSHGDLLLLDFGLRWESMPSDMSRTIPVNGRFNPLQKILYNIVLEAQQEVERLAKPGVLLSALNDHCWTFIETQLKQFSKKTKARIMRAYKNGPHYVGHLVGLQVHDGDPYRDYKSLPLQPGWVISNEPGFYGRITCQIEGVHYDETIGIRIEDNLLITTRGCENLTTESPKTIDEIEQLITQ